MESSKLSAAQQKALQDAVKLVADLIVDAVEAGKSYNGVGGVMEDFANIGGDLMVLVSEIGNFPSPALMGEEDYAMLVASLAADLVFPSSLGNVAKVMENVMVLLKDLSTVVVPDVINLVQSIEAK